MIPLTALPSMIAWKALRRIRSRVRRLRVTKLGRPGGVGRGTRRLVDIAPGVRFFAFVEIESDREAFVSLWKDLFPAAAGLTLQAAEQALQHTFDLLGSGPVGLGDRIDWSRDFKSGKVWERLYFEDIPEIDLSDSSDIKVPWELSRFYHFAALGKAYVLTGDEKYTREFIGQLVQWMEDNPPYHGVNWHCAMEVAYRAINWIWGYHFFRRSPLLTPELKRRFVASLAVHGRFIRDNLEFDKRLVGRRYVPWNHNHYLADLVGLAYLGVVMPGRLGRRWRAMAVRRLVKEIDAQILDDGVHWELSLSYHRLVLEMSLSAVILLRDNGISIPQRSLDKLARAAGFIMNYTRPDGLAPLVRDADDGRLHRLSSSGAFRDHRHLLPVVAAYLGRPELRGRNDSFSEDALWMLGSAGYQAFTKLGGEPAPLVSKAFPDAQYFVMRGPHDAHVFVSVAGIGMRGAHGGHAHNDCLSFEAFCQGESFITDSGTYVYSADPALRNLFKSTESHNTVRVDGEEINRFSPQALFGMQNDAAPRVRAWRSTQAEDFLDAEHYGYRRLPDPVVHRRSYLLERERGMLLITDELEGTGRHLFEIFLHFSPGVSLLPMGEGIYQARKGAAAVLLYFPDLEAGWQLSTRECWISERYGRKERGVSIVATARREPPALFRSMVDLNPWTGEAAPQTRALREAAESLSLRKR